MYDIQNSLMTQLPRIPLYSWHYTDIKSPDLKGVSPSAKYERILATAMMWGKIQYFPDVPPSYWGFPYIEYMYTNDIISGYLDGTFKPNNNVTRAQFCKMIVNTLGIEQYFPATPTFSDVAPDYWGYGYIEAAHKEGIINGYVDGTFRPNNEVSRQHVAAMIARAVGLTYSGTEVVFSDVPVDHPYYEEIMACYDAGIISGYMDGTFRPNNIATRAHASKFLCGMVGIVF